MTIIFFYNYYLSQNISYQFQYEIIRHYLDADMSTFIISLPDGLSIHQSIYVYVSILKIMPDVIKT